MMVAPLPALGLDEELENTPEKREKQKPHMLTASRQLPNENMAVGMGV